MGWPPPVNSPPSSSSPITNTKYESTLPPADAMLASIPNPQYLLPSDPRSDMAPFHLQHHRVPSQHEFFAPPIPPEYNVPRPQPQPAPRQRTAIACRYCRRRKIRCSGVESSVDGKCGNCSRFSQNCVFSPVSSQAQAFVPVHAATAAWRPDGAPPTLYTAHGHPMHSSASIPQQPQQYIPSGTVPYPCNYDERSPVNHGIPVVNNGHSTNSHAQVPPAAGIGSTSFSGPLHSPYYSSHAPPLVDESIHSPGRSSPQNYDANRASLSPHAQMQQLPGYQLYPDFIPGSGTNSMVPRSSSSPGVGSTGSRPGMRITDLVREDGPGDNGRSVEDRDMLDALNRRGRGM